MPKEEKRRDRYIYIYFICSFFSLSFSTSKSISLFLNADCTHVQSVHIYIKNIYIYLMHFDWCIRKGRPRRGIGIYLKARRLFSNIYKYRTTLSEFYGDVSGAHLLHFPRITTMQNLFVCHLSAYWNTFYFWFGEKQSSDRVTGAFLNTRLGK